MTRAMAGLVSFIILVAIGIAACGATAGPNSGELMFDFGSDEEDAGADDEARTPLELDAGP